jgi:group I intron endonuclease
MNNVIYKITHKETGKCYIGFTKNFQRRMNMHKHLSSLDNPQQHIHKAIKKYGWDKFNREVIEENVENLPEKEIFYIKEYDTYNNGYNMTTGGENNIGYEYGEHHSQQIKKAFSVVDDNGKTKGHNCAIRMVQKRRSYVGKNNPFYGKKHSLESKQRMRKPKTEEAKANMRKPKSTTENMKGKKSQSHIANLKKAKAKESVRICPHCGKEGKGGNMTRYHFENCKAIV